MIEFTDILRNLLTYFVICKNNQSEIYYNECKPKILRDLVILKKSNG